jgi:hypothetical protein
VEQPTKPAIIKTAQAKSNTCEDYREEVNKYFGDYTDQALFVFGKESRGCTLNKSLKANRNGTWDYCIAQINNEPSVQNDLDKCISRAWDKFKPYKHWSQWYAVCKPNREPKYPNIKCK